MKQQDRIVTFFQLYEEERNSSIVPQSVAEWLSRSRLAVGDYHYAVLLPNGTVTAHGDNRHGQCNTSSWRDIVKIAAGANHTVGLKGDGTVVAVGDNRNGQCNVSVWRDITDIYAENDMTFAIDQKGTLKAIAASDPTKKERNPHHGNHEIPGMPSIPSPGKDFLVDRFGSGVVVNQYIGDAATVVIPHVINGKKVDGIGFNAFGTFSDIREVVFSRDLSIVGNSVCEDCRRLERVWYLCAAPIPDSAFSGCVSLSDVYLADGVTGIGRKAFRSCPSLKTIFIPDSVLAIAPDAFDASITFRCSQGSYAAQFASLHGIKRIFNVYVGLSMMCYTIKKE